MKKEYIKIPKDFGKDLNFKIEVSPIKGKCCCGYENCIDLDCLMEENRKYPCKIIPKENFKRINPKFKYGKPL